MEDTKGRIGGTGIPDGARVHARSNGKTHHEEEEDEQAMAGENTTVALLLKEIAASRAESNQWQQSFMVESSRRHEQLIASIGGNGNGKRVNGIATLAIALLLPLGGAVGWIANSSMAVGSVRTAMELELKGLRSDIDRLQRELGAEAEERKKDATWNEKLRLNLAEHGYRVDAATAEVKRSR